MKSLYTARHIAEAHLLRGYLESQGVNAIVRGEYLLGAMGELPGDLCKVCVMDERDFARADALLREFLQGAAAHGTTHAAWRCLQCDEQLEGQFTDCWNCGASRASPPGV
jgi:hypothetical protein